MGREEDRLAPYQVVTVATRSEAYEYSRKETRVVRELGPLAAEVRTEEAKNERLRLIVIGGAVVLAVAVSLLSALTSELKQVLVTALGVLGAAQLVREIKKKRGE